MKRLFYVTALSAIMLASCTQSPKEKEVAAPAGPAATEVAAQPDALIIIATLTAQPEFRDELWAAVEAVVKGTRQEAGNNSYNVFIDTTDPLKWTFIENWKSQAAIDRHNASPHFQTFAKAIEGKAGLTVAILKPSL
jgi:quinol monooxygenase YgiN